MNRATLAAYGAALLMEARRRASAGKRDRPASSVAYDKAVRKELETIHERWEPTLRDLKEGTWLGRLTAAVADTEVKHPAQEVVGFRHRSALELNAPENQGIAFVPVPECGGWLALRARGDRREASASPAADKMQAARDLAADLDGVFDALRAPTYAAAPFTEAVTPAGYAKRAGLVIAYVSKGDERLKLCGAFEADYPCGNEFEPWSGEPICAAWHRPWRVTGPAGASFHVMSGGRVWCEGLVFPLPAADEQAPQAAETTAQWSYEKGELARLVAEREEAIAIAQLRRLCHDFGDGDWTSDMKLADIVATKLADSLYRAFPNGLRHLGEEESDG